MDTNAATYSDYMFVISLPRQVEVMIDKYKRATAKWIGYYDGLKSTAHISITQQYRQMPGVITQKLDYYQKTVGKLTPILLNINGFNFFKNNTAGLTIYAKIQLNDEVERWFKQVRRVLGEKATMVPHITIAKCLSPEQFQIVWPKVIETHYQESFTPQSVTVLSKPMIGGYKAWTPFRQLYFNNF